MKHISILTLLSALVGPLAYANSLTLTGPSSIHPSQCSGPYSVTRETFARDTQATVLGALHAKLYRGNLCQNEISPQILSFTADDAQVGFYLRDASVESLTLIVSLPSGATSRLAIKVSSPTPTPTPVPIVRFNVKDVKYGAKGDGVADETAAFEAAIAAASQAAIQKADGLYPIGPAGLPQGVVYVPAGKYRVKSVQFKSHVRLEIDAAAVIMLFGKRTGVAGGGGKTSMFELDAPTPPTVADQSKYPPLRNVTIIGVGTSTADKPMPYPGWDLSHSFTINDDPVATQVDAGVFPILLGYVDGWLLANIFSIQNNSDPDNSEGDTDSRGAIISTKVSTSAPVGGPYYDPTNGEYRNHYNIGSHSGFGPNQFQSGHHIRIFGIYTEGGTALRLETDLSQHLMERYYSAGCSDTNPCALKFGAEINDVTISNVQCRNGNRALSFAAHNQVNRLIHATDIRSDNCYEGFVQSSEGGKYFPGAFLKSTVDGISIIGSNYKGSGEYAQLAQPATDSFLPNQKSSATIVIGNDSASWGFSVKNCTYRGDFSDKNLSINGCVRAP